jgi:hypothetical protein
MPTALQLRSPLDDAIAIAACSLILRRRAGETRGGRGDKWRLRAEQNQRLLLRARARARAAGEESERDGDIQMPPAIGRNILVPARHWAT